MGKYSNIVSNGISGGSALNINDEGVSIDGSVTKINFIGPGINAVENEDHEIDVTVTSDIHVHTYSTITSDMLLTDNIPAGYALTSILFEETVGNNITINIGSTNGGTEILYNETLTASSSKLFIFNRFFSSSTTQTIDINSSDWNSASLNITIKLSPVTV